MRRLARIVLLRVPERWQRRLRALPLLGGALSRLSHAASPKGVRTWTTVKRGPGEGLRMRLDPRFERFVWAGEDETTLLGTVLVEHLHPDAIVYDVGANSGLYSLIAARCLDGGRVYAFEPDPDNLARIREHVAANGLDGVVEPIAAAVWSSTGRVRFVADDVYPNRDRGRVAGDDGDMDAVSLDDFAATHPLPTVLKIDVEGGEEEVLRGAAGVLAAATPLVLCEVHMEAGREAARLDRVRALLEARGYEVESLDPGFDPVHLVARPRRLQNAS